MNSVEWLAKLISYPTLSSNSNLALIREIQDWLAQYPSILMQLTYDETGHKANLFATLPAQDGNVLEGGLIFSGHTDVVPVEGQQWGFDPFNAKITSDRVYGRGACDMKGFIAVILALVPELVKEKRPQPLHFAFSYDEEVGCRGAPLLIADFQKRGIRPAACIVGEPTEMHIVIAHKSIHVFRCRIQGQSAHSSLTPMGCNAIEYAAYLITWIRELANQFKQLGPHDKCYDVAFSTMTTNQIQGGTAVNIIPNACEFLFELRNLPKIDPNYMIEQIKAHINENLLPRMQEECSHASIQLDALCAVPGFAASEKATITQLVRTITNEKEKRKVSYATEAGLFQQAGIPTVVCGPGSIAEAHRPDEFVLLEQLTACEKFIRTVGSAI
ncbi:MAG: argE [Gammaproteobacteria bacterium]|jgi:acetylornithine deacetylase|nr:argE [Gammaproteobacteria bacterium]